MGYEYSEPKHPDKTIETCVIWVCQSCHWSWAGKFDKCPKCLSPWIDDMIGNPNLKVNPDLVNDLNNKDFLG